MTFHFRPAKRANTPLIIGLAGPTKSGKTLSALRIATGLAQDGIAMINAEGAKGHQYADRFHYVATDIEPPYRPERFNEAVQSALAIKPAVLIIDSASHMHDGPGGMLDYHEDELNRLAGAEADDRRRQRYNWSAWIRPKKSENDFIYTLLSADAHVILCFRAKEKLKIVPGREPIDLGFQPIAGDRIAFETLFTLLLPPHSKGVPDLAQSDMREPFDTLIPGDQQLSEDTGRRLAHWAKGSGTVPQEAAVSVTGASFPPPEVPDGTSTPAAEWPQASAVETAPQLSEEQSAELDELVGALRDRLGVITTEQLWASMAAARAVDADVMEDLLGGRGEDGTLLTDPLLQSLTPAEAEQLISRLRNFLNAQEAVAASTSANWEKESSG